MLTHLGAACTYVRAHEEIEQVDGLVLPGGESTTIGKLMARFGLLDVVQERAAAGMPVLGTCAGAILLATEIEESTQERLGLVPMTVRRNAYGRQIESFECDLDAGSLHCGAPPEDGGGAAGQSAAAGQTNHSSTEESLLLRGVFIRAPIITAVGDGCEVLVRYEDLPVIVRYGAVFAATFHPELSGEERLHRCFLQTVANASEGVRRTA